MCPEDLLRRAPAFSCPGSRCFGYRQGVGSNLMGVSDVHWTEISKPPEAIVYGRFRHNQVHVDGVPAMLAACHLLRST